MSFQYHALDKCQACGHLFHDHSQGGCFGLTGNPENSGMCCCSQGTFLVEIEPQVFNPEAFQTLLNIEVEYLKANGWQEETEIKAPLGHGQWTNPSLHRNSLTHGHAVNVQKQRDRISAEPWDRPSK